jgi:hypothetical protein
VYRSSEGCGNPLGRPSGPVIGRDQGLIPADEGSGQGFAAALWVPNPGLREGPSWAWFGTGLW